MALGMQTTIHHPPSPPPPSYSVWHVSPREVAPPLVPQTLEVTLITISLFGIQIYRYCTAGSSNPYPCIFLFLSTRQVLMLGELCNSSSSKCLGRLLNFRLSSTT